MNEKQKAELLHRIVEVDSIFFDTLSTFCKQHYLSSTASIPVELRGAFAQFVREQTWLKERGPGANHHAPAQIQ